MKINNLNQKGMEFTGTKVKKNDAGQAKDGFISSAGDDKFMSSVDRLKEMKTVDILRPEVEEIAKFIENADNLTIRSLTRGMPPFGLKVEDNQFLAGTHLLTFEKDGEKKSLISDTEASTHHMAVITVGETDMKGCYMGIAGENEQLAGKEFNIYETGAIQEAIMENMKKREASDSEIKDFNAARKYAEAIMFGKLDQVDPGDFVF